MEDAQPPAGPNLIFGIIITATPHHLVFKSPVRSGLLPQFWGNRTATGLFISKI